MKDFKQLFPGANTPQGFRSLYHAGLAGIERVFILKGGPGIGKSTLMRKIAAELDNMGYGGELWQCSSDSSSIDGIICRQLGIAVIDGTAPHIVDPSYPGVVEEIVNLGDYWDEEKLKANGEQIISLFKSISASFAEGYTYLAKAEEKRRELLAICAEPYDKRTEKNLLDKIFTGKEPLKFFASAVTDKGLVSYAQSITQNCAKRYILQGKQNENAALLLQAVSIAAREKGLSIEEYYSPFESERLEIVVLPGLSTAIIDATQKHTQIKLRASDYTVDLSQPVFSVENEHEKEYQNAFESELEKTVSCFAQAKAKHDKLEEFYTAAMDFDGVDLKGRELIDKIMKIIKQKG